MSGKLARLKEKMIDLSAMGAAIIAIAVTGALVLAYVVLYLGFPFAILWVAIHFLRKVW